MTGLKVESGEEDCVSSTRANFAKSKVVQKAHSTIKKKPGIQQKRKAVGVNVRKCTIKKRKLEVQATLHEKEWMSTESDGFSSDAGTLPRAAMVTESLRHYCSQLMSQLLLSQLLLLNNLCWTPPLDRLLLGIHHRTD